VFISCICLSVFILLYLHVILSERRASVYVMYAARDLGNKAIYNRECINKY